MEKKYKFTDESINVLGRTLYRIEALKDFSNIKKGDKGGYIESEANLSQEGNCWVYDNAKVFINAKIFNNARICDNTWIYENAQIYSNAIVSGDAQIFGDALVYGQTAVLNQVQIYGNARICDHTIICDHAKIYEDALIYGNAKICGNVEIKGDAKVYNNSDYIVFKNWWSSGRYFTWTKSNNMWKVGCFYGTGKELIEKAYKDSELSGREYERIVNYVETIIKDSL